MNKLIATTLIASVLAAPAFAQNTIVPPASPEASPTTNAAIAHHDRVVAHRAARHGHYHKAAAANHAADAASAQAANPR